METTMAMLVASSEIASTCLRGHPQGCCWVPLHKKRRVYAMEKTLPYYGWWMIIIATKLIGILYGKVKNVSTRVTEISLRSSHAGFTGRIGQSQWPKKHFYVSMCCRKMHPDGKCGDGSIMNWVCYCWIETSCRSSHVFLLSIPFLECIGRFLHLLLVYFDTTKVLVMGNGSAYWIDICTHLSFKFLMRSYSHTYMHIDV